MHNQVQAEAALTIDPLKRDSMVSAAQRRREREQVKRMPSANLDLPAEHPDDFGNPTAPVWSALHD